MPFLVKISKGTQWKREKDKQVAWGIWDGKSLRAVAEISTFVTLSKKTACRDIL
jgi:hypothetical protein